MKYIDDQIKVINAAIERYIRADGNSKFLEAGRYTIWPEGHRYRSLVGLEIYKMLGGNQFRFLKGVVGIEAIHHASLVFDDLPCMDNSPTRKGKPTTHIEYGEDIAILSGLYLWELGRHLVYDNTCEHLDKPEDVDEVESLIHQTIVGLLHGQEIDLQKHKSDDDLRESIYQKNRMFHFACVLPAYLLQKKEYIDPLSAIGNILDEVGVHLSVGYQLFDDLRDVEGVPEVIGKPVGLDVNKETSVKRYGINGVKQQLAERIQRIKENLRKIEPNSRLESIVEHILTKQS